MAAITGRGTSAEEAKQNCLRKLSLELEAEIEVVRDRSIPLKEAERIPPYVPAGCQLVIFARSSHCHGGTYNWRFFALPFGRHIVAKRKIKVTDRCPVYIDTMDSNSDVTYPLPDGSVEYVDGRWLPSFGVEYDY